MTLSSTRIFNALLVGGFIAWLIAWSPFSDDTPATPCLLELTATSPADGTLVLRINDGHGFADDRPSDLAVRIRVSPQPTPVRVLVPPGQVVGLRLTIFGTPQLAVHGARVAYADGKPLAALANTDFKIAGGAVASRVGHALQLSPRSPDERIFEFDIIPKTPITVASGNEPSALGALGIWVAASTLVFLVLTLSKGRFSGHFSRWQKWKDIAQRRPRSILAVIALLAAVLSSYPVVFLGKSFVSPNNDAHLLYFKHPTLPNTPVEPAEDMKGSDTGALMWCHVPYTALVGEALFEDHEWPLWNRYDSAGVPLLGQAQSMLGDPLGLIPLLSGSAAWAWDLKFILAKALFALGVGFCVLNLTRSFGIAALMAASSVWIGFYAFRFAHVAVFSLAYGPWILLPWLALRDDGSRRNLLRCGVGLFFANWCELNSGTAKESAMLILFLNATGLLVLLCSRESWRERLRRILPMLWANVLFILVSAPLWLVFLDALSRSVTVYDTPSALQLPAGLMLGFFDGIFTQDFTRLENHTHPSLNFLMLAGFLWFVTAARWRESRTALAIFLSTLLPAALVFGIFPPHWIMATPFLGNIVHVHNTFGCVLLVLVPLLAALGLRHLWEIRGTPEWTATWRKMLAALAILVAAYLSFTQAQGQAPDARFHIDPTWHGRFFARYAPALILAAALLPWFLHRRAWGAVALALFALHFRHGMYDATKFDAYVMNPRTGADLHAESPALQRSRDRSAGEPYRSVGFSGTLSPGYNALLRLETIYGADALMNRYYHELCRANQLSFTTWRLILGEDQLPEAKPFCDLLNLRYYLRTPSSQPAPAGLSLVDSSDLDLLESRTAWPRAFFTDRIKNYSTIEELASLIASGDGRPFAAVQGAPLPLQPGEQITAANAYRFTSNTTSFAIHASGPGLAVLSETFEDDNFQVTVNGQPARCLRINHAFKGVEIPASGDYRIEFRYWPRVLTPALWLAGLGLALGTATLLVARFRRAKPAQP
jgi:hypothetical protein